MSARIDPRTGGIIFVEEEKEEERIAQLNREISALKSELRGDILDVNISYNPLPSRLSLDERYKLALSVGESCIQEEELYDLLKRKVHPICYDGFEPSGRMHIAQGVFKAINVNKLVDAGCIFIFWVADWFAMLNNKMGGDLDKIRNVGRYFIEVWKAIGMKMSNVKFLWASEEINKNPNKYWLQVMDVARKNNIPRIIRCSQIMGRKESENLTVAQLLYPCMQCTDIFYLNADICQLGTDQIKVNVLAREYCDDIQKNSKPVILSHRMLPGLLEGQDKASKSDPNSAIFMEDDASEVKKKVKSSFCPEGVVEKNPVLSYTKYVVFEYYGEMLITRKPEWGGNKLYKNYQDLEDDFVAKTLHPDDLKTALAAAINKILEPVRNHFKNDPEARKLLELIRSYQVTK